MNQPVINSPRTNLEIILVLLTGVGKLVFVNWLDVKFWFIMVAGAGWLGYLLWSLIANRERMRGWGFQRAGFWASMRLLLVPSLLVVVLCYGYGYYTGNMIVTWRIVPVLILYPLWGVIQQWLVICLFGSNLLAMRLFPMMVIYLLTATLFGVIHLPSILLVAGTFVLALVYLYVFARYRNIWTLGLLHGWLGGIFYYFALGRDAWLEFTKVL
jgi:hypothetical protein